MKMNVSLLTTWQVERNNTAISWHRWKFAFLMHHDFERKKKKLAAVSSRGEIFLDPYILLNTSVRRQFAHYFWGGMETSRWFSAIWKGKHIITRTNRLNREAQSHKAEDGGSRWQKTTAFAVFSTIKKKKNGNNFESTIAEMSSRVIAKAHLAHLKTN